MRLLVAYVKGLSEVNLAAPPLRNLVATHVHDLLAMVVGATRDGAAIAQERGIAAARLAAVKANVIENIGDGELALPAIAARHGLTPRAVQRLFEREGSSFSAFRLEQQLARAHRMLGDGRFTTWTVAAIAGAAGFGDLSYFHRVFRRRFGVTPGDVRAASA